MFVIRDNTAADVIASLLDQLDETDVYVENEPDAPDAVITTYDTSPVIQGRNMTDGEVWEYFGVQVRVRAAKKATAGATARRIATLMSAVRDATVNVPDPVGTATNQYLVKCVQRTSGPLSIGRESPTSQRCLYTLNLLVTLKQTA